MLPAGYGRKSFCQIKDEMYDHIKNVNSTRYSIIKMYKVLMRKFKWCDADTLFFNIESSSSSSCGEDYKLEKDLGELDYVQVQHVFCVMRKRNPTLTSSSVAK